MNRQELDGMWDHLRKVQGIGLRCIEAIPADKFDARPVPNMRTPKELAIHMYAMVLRECTESVTRGNVTEIDEKGFVAAARTKDDVLAFCRAQWTAADQAARKVTDAQLQSMIQSPWGSDFPGFVMFGIVHDEYLHHRGQLYAYLRALGVEPPMLWDFEHNDPAFQPKAATATA